MNRRVQLAFLFLIGVQATHSWEECLTRLYDVFAPARAVSGLVSADLSRGFLLLNVALVTFGFACWAGPVRSGWRTAGAAVWFWTLLEFGNGINHLGMAFWRHGYFPGVATAPLLLFAAAWLATAARRATPRAVAS